MTENPVPHNLDAERSVLGAILVDNATYPVVAEVLDSRAFFRYAHIRIFEHLAALAKGNQPIDLVMLKESLQRSCELDEVGGPAYIASLIDGVPVAINAEYYARVVREHWIKRTLITELGHRIDEAYKWEGPVAELLERVVGSATALSPRQLVEASELFVTAADTCRNQDRPPMLLAPYLVEGSIGSFVANIKSGKTATTLEMVRCLRHRVGFCGFPPPAARVRVMYCTEQPRASFVNQLQDAGLQGDEDVVVTYLSSWRGRPWSQVAPALVQAALEHGTQFLVLDTGSQWFGFREDQENQSGAAASVQLLQPLVAQGATILISRHGRKSGGSAHDAGRGSSAIDGAVDFIINLTKPTGEPPEVRELEAVGRFEMPERFQIRRRANFQHLHPIEISAVEKLAARYVFEPVTTHAETPKSRIRAFLGQGAKTAKQISVGLGLSVNTITRALEDMAGEVLQVGKGGPRNNAALYGLKDKTTTSPSQSLRDGDVESSQRAS